MIAQDWNKIYEGYPEIKDTKQVGGKVNHRYEGGNTVMSNLLPFPLVFAFKEISGQPEVSRR